MPYNFLLRYDCEIFCAIHIKNIILAVKKDDEKKKQVIHTTFVLETRVYSYFLINVRTLSQKLNFSFIICINGLDMYLSTCIMRNA